jgi:pimeloyl-ACP methyl ester carboxylesterase
MTTSSTFTPVSQPNAPALSRLALYDAATQTYVPVTEAHSIGHIGQRVYVMTHGWAFGYAPDVTDYASENDGALLMVWETLSFPSGGNPAGAWMFQGTSGPQEHPIPVSPVGMAQAIQQLDPGAAVLIFSWLDGAATPEVLSDGNYSQANTDMYGLIAASAIEQALDRRMFELGGKLHLLGHSDGTKVMTVAAATLRTDYRIEVAQLTLFDSPENAKARQKNSANFLWYYLRQVPGHRPHSGPEGTFIDSYISMFGTTLSKFSYTAPGGASVDLRRIVDTDLASSVLYGDLPTEDGNRHAYAPAWYSGTSLDTTYGGNQYGLGWSPLLHDRSVAGALPEEETQTWTGPTAQSQFVLAPTTAPAQSPVFTSLDAASLALSAEPGAPPATQQISLSLPAGSVDGFTFNYRFVDPSPDATLSVTLNGTLLFTMVGGWSGSTERSATLNAASLMGVEDTLAFTLTNAGTTKVQASVGHIFSFSGIDG